MKRAEIIWIFLSTILVFIGCENPGPISTGHDSGSQLQQYLQTMNHVRVTLIGNTNHHSLVKQTSFDPGAEHDLWLPRKYCFANTDTTFILHWHDSAFTTSACFSAICLSPLGYIEYGCGGNTTLRGIYHSQENTVTELLSFYSELDNPQGGYPDDNNYRDRYASITIPRVELDSVFDDSITFIIKDQSLWQSVVLSYKSDEKYYGSFIRQQTYQGIDLNNTEYPPECRIVFFKK